MFRKFLYPILLSISLLAGIMAGCGPDMMLRSKEGTSKTLQSETWGRVYFYEDSEIRNCQEWDFKAGELFTTGIYKNGAPNSVVKYSYAVSSNLMNVHLIIEKLDPNPDPNVLGKWKIIKLKKMDVSNVPSDSCHLNAGKKHTLRMTRSGAKDDKNPATREGGLIMLEFVAR